MAQLVSRTSTFIATLLFLFLSFAFVSTHGKWTSGVIAQDVLKKAATKSFPPLSSRNHNFVGIPQFQHPASNAFQNVIQKQTSVAQEHYSTWALWTSTFVVFCTGIALSLLRRKRPPLIAALASTSGKPPADDKEAEKWMTEDDLAGARAAQEKEWQEMVNLPDPFIGESDVDEEMIEDLPDEEKARMLFGMRYADTLARGFSTQVYRDSEGHLVAGWGHRLTPEEQKIYKEGDVVDDATLDRWEDEEELDEDKVAFTEEELEQEIQDKFGPDGTGFTWDKFAALDSAGLGDDLFLQDKEELRPSAKAKAAMTPAESKEKAGDKADRPRFVEISGEDEAASTSSADMYTFGSALGDDPGLSAGPPPGFPPAQPAGGWTDAMEEEDSVGKGLGMGWNGGAGKGYLDAGKGGKQSRRRIGFVRGTVTRWLPARGFGFCNTDDGLENVFIHQSAIMTDGFRYLTEGERIEFELVDVNGRLTAMDVRSLGGGSGKAPSKGKPSWPTTTGGGKGGQREWTTFENEPEAIEFANPRAGWGGRGPPLAAMEGPDPGKGSGAPKGGKGGKGIEFLDDFMGRPQGVGKGYTAVGKGFSDDGKGKGFGGPGSPAAFGSTGREAVNVPTDAFRPPGGDAYLGGGSYGSGKGGPGPVGPAGYGYGVPAGSAAGFGDGGGKGVKGGFDAAAGKGKGGFDSMMDVEGMGDFGDMDFALDNPDPFSGKGLAFPPAGTRGGFPEAAGKGAYGPASGKGGFTDKLSAGGFGAGKGGKADFGLKGGKGDPSSAFGKGGPDGFGGRGGPAGFEESGKGGGKGYTGFGSGDNFGSGSVFGASAGKGAYGEAGKGGFSEAGKGAYGEAGKGAYGEAGKGAYGEAGKGAYGEAGKGGFGEAGKGAYGEAGKGAYGEAGKGAYGKTGKGAYGEAGKGAYGEAGKGAYGEAGKGAYGEAGKGGFGEAGKGGFGEAGKGAYGEAGKGAYGEAGKGAYGEAGKGGFGEAGKVGFGEAGKGAYGEAGKGGFGEAGKGGFGEAGKGAYGEAGKGAYGEAGKGAYGEADKVAYGETGKGGFGEAGKGAYGEAGKGAYGEAGKGAYGEAGKGAYGEAGKGGFGETGRGGFGEAGKGGFFTDYGKGTGKGYSGFGGEEGPRGYGGKGGAGDFGGAGGPADFGGYGGKGLGGGPGKGGPFEAAGKGSANYAGGKGGMGGMSGVPSFTDQGAGFSGLGGGGKGGFTDPGSAGKGAYSPFGGKGGKGDYAGFDGDSVGDFRNFSGKGESTAGPLMSGKGAFADGMGKGNAGKGYMEAGSFAGADGKGSKGWPAPRPFDPTPLGGKGDAPGNMGYGGPPSGFDSGSVPFMTGKAASGKGGKDGGQFGGKGGRGRPTDPTNPPLDFEFEDANPMGGKGRFAEIPEGWQEFDQSRGRGYDGLKGGYRLGRRRNFIFDDAAARTDTEIGD